MPFLTISSGYSIAHESGSLVHIGMDDTFAGKVLSLKVFEKIPPKNQVAICCIDHMRGVDFGVHSRCVGVKEAIEQKNGVVRIFQVDGSEPKISIQVLKALIEQFSNEIAIDAIVSVGDLGTNMLVE